MVERGGERGFAQQPIERVLFGVGAGDEHAADDFQRDVAPEPRVVRAINLAHPAGAELVDTSYGPTREPWANNMLVHRRRIRRGRG